MVGIMIQNIFHEAVKLRYQMMPFSGMVKKLNDRAPQTRIENGEPILEVWREYHGFTFEQMAQKSGVSVEKYLDYESENRQVPFATQKRICHSLEIHPIEFYDYNDICDPEYMRLLIDAFNNHTSYRLFGRNMYEELIEAIEYQGDEDESLNPLKDYRQQMLSTNKNYSGYGAHSGKEFLVGLIDELVINDGNPYFANYLLPSEAIENARQQHLETLKQNEAAMNVVGNDIKRHEKDMERVSEYLFGSMAGELIQKWFSYYEDMPDERDFHSIFADDVQDYARSEADVSDADAFFDGMVYMFEQYKKSMDLALDAFELTERIDALERFQREMSVTLSAYDNRQIILAETQLLEPYGMQNHSSYISLPQPIDCEKRLKLKP